MRLWLPGDSRNRHRRMLILASQTQNAGSPMRLCRHCKVLAGRRCQLPRTTNPDTCSHLSPQQSMEVISAAQAMQACHPGS